MSEGIGVVGGLYGSVDQVLKKFGIEPPGNIKNKEVHEFIRKNQKIGWITKHTKEEGVFEPLNYSIGFDTNQPLRIPPSNIRYSIHFFPPESQEALNKETEEDPWWAQDKYVEKGELINRKYFPMMVEFLALIKNGKFPDMDFVVALTNPRMAKMAFALGFKRCWPEGDQPPDLTREIQDDRDVIIGTSIQDLKKLYDLENQEASIAMVNKQLKRYVQERRVVRNMSPSA